MKLYLNAGNGVDPMGAHAIRFIKDHLFDGVRLGILNGLSVARIEPIVGELARADLDACLIVGGWDWEDGGGRKRAPSADTVAADAIAVARAAQAVGLRFCLEIGNEPNLAPRRHKRDPGGFALYVQTIAMAVATAPGLEPVTFVSGGVSNVNPWDGLKYLRAVARELAPGVVLGVHPYRMGDRPWDELGGRPMPSIGFEIAAMHPRFTITEGGWHTAPRRAKRDFPLCFSYQEVQGWTDEEVAAFATHELDFWEGIGAEFYVWYQINDGLTNTQEDRFGIRTARAGEPKPVALALKEWRARRNP